MIVKAKRYLADHYDDAELTLFQVAEHVGLSEKYFTNRFTKETGETFSNYLTQLRIQKAKELLRTTTFKSYEIGEMVGYRNAEHFTRMFKRKPGARRHSIENRVNNTKRRIKSCVLLRLFKNSNDRSRMAKYVFIQNIKKKKI